MHTSTLTNLVPGRFRIPLLIILIAAGAAGNHFHYQIFLNIDFLFGSIFALLAMQFLGFTRGVAASVIIASYTFVLWNHPYAIIIMTAEVVVVGIMMQRYKLGMVMADTCYWLIIGMPLGYIFYHMLMSSPMTSTSMVMIKQAINGITNALVARYIFTFFVWRSRLVKTPLNEIVYNLLAFFVLFPTLFLIASSSRHDFSETDATIRSALHHNNQVANQTLSHWLLNSSLPIVNLAGLAPSKSPQEMQPFIDQVAKSDFNIMSVGLMDRNGHLVAFSPGNTETQKSIISLYFNEHPYRAALHQTHTPMLSVITAGTEGITKPVVLILVPVIIEGEYAGRVASVLNIEQLKRDLDNSVGYDAMFYTLIDQNSNVIMTNRPEKTVMQPFIREHGVIEQLSDGSSQWIPVLPANTPIMERWKQSVYISESTVGSLAEWRLILEQPVMPYQKKLYSNYTNKLIILSLVLLAALILAEFFSRRIHATFEALGFITHDLSRRLANEGVAIDWPESNIKEAAQLVKNFQDMAVSLSAQFVTIKERNESLKHLVEELRESEARFSTMFRNHSAVMLLIEPEDGAIIDANHAAEIFYEYPLEKLTSMKIEDINMLPPETIENERKRAMSGLQDLFIFHHKKANGEIRNVEVHSTSISIHGSDILFSIINDITERKQAEEERNKLQAQLQHTRKLEAIGTLAGGIAHDFNNILGAIIGYAEIIQDDCPSGSATAHDIQQVLHASHRARELVKQILAFSKQAETSKLPMKPASIILETVKMLRSTLPATIDIRQSIDKDTGCILADPTQIHQILMNLSTNSFHAMEETGGTLSIALKRKELTPEDLKGREHILSGSFIHLSVADSGSGIAPELQEKIFDPYFTTKETGKGSGMGLAIVHGIVTSCDGYITCHSKRGEGTVFDVYLPVIAGDELSQMQREQPIQYGSEHILFIDDEEMLADMCKSMLERLGYRVTTRTNVFDAINTFHNQPDEFDMVITDQTMPGMTGSDLALRLLQIRPELPIILCTGFSTIISEETSKKLGIKGYAMKPLTKKDIAVLIRKVFDEGQQCRNH